MDVKQAQEVMSAIIERNGPSQTLDGNQIDPSSAHMTDKEQWRYYGGKLRVLSEVETMLDQRDPHLVQAWVRGQLDMVREVTHHIQLRMEAKRHGALWLRMGWGAAFLGSIMQQQLSFAFDDRKPRLILVRDGAIRAYAELPDTSRWTLDARARHARPTQPADGQTRDDCRQIPLQYRA
ncbi:hypothetical protein Q3G72_017171 [Acer saccharum]|nr:hypothetical protein Q3G72_004452 [Acer saccharum]KAK1548592.1 hypothetical protein Q3G72_017171 [Acer saccharum]